MSSFSLSIADTSFPFCCCQGWPWDTHRQPMQHCHWRTSTFSLIPIQCCVGVLFAVVLNWYIFMFLPDPSFC